MWVQHDLGTQKRSQAVLGCLYHLAREKKFFQCLVDDWGLFGRAPAPSKTAPALLVERLLW